MGPAHLSRLNVLSYTPCVWPLVRHAIVVTIVTTDRLAHVRLEQIGDYRQHQTDLNTKHENKSHVHYDYKVGDKVLVQKMASSAKLKAFTTVNTEENLKD